MQLKMAEEGSKSGFVFLATIRHGQDKLGVEQGPHALSKRNKFPEDVVFVGTTCDGTAPEESFIISTNPTVPIQSPQVVGRANKQLYEAMRERCKEFMARNGHLPSILVLGGDHSLAIGSVSAISNICHAALKDDQQKNKLPFTVSDLVVFWIDAHADLNTPSVTESGKLHGCPVSLLAGFDETGWRELKHFDWVYERMPTDDDSDRRPFINPSKLVYIGLRDVDKAEGEIIDQHRIIAHDMDKVKINRDMRKIVADSLKRVDPTGSCPIHISFDIDGIDPRFAPATGTPVPDGLLPEEGVQIIRAIKETGRLVSMDLVEVNPSIGNAEEVSNTLHTAKMLTDTFYS